MRSNRWTLVAICLATFMLLLDITIVQVALPAISRHLHGGLASLQWTVDAYALPLSALIVTFGTLSDRWGRRLIFLAGVIGFTAASIACGGAQTIGELVLARAGQGVAGAAMFATTLALIGQEFTGAARGRAIAAWGATVGAAVASGPIVGGVLVDTLGWRSIFYVNVPIGITVVILTLRTVAEGRDEARPVDWLGLVTLSAGLTLVTAGLLRGTDTNWTGSFGPATILVGFASLGLFVLSQRRLGAMFDRQIVTNPAFLGVSLAVFTLGAGMFAMLLFLTIYLQNVLRLSPLQGGLRLLPITLPVFIVPFIARKARVPVVSGTVIGVGMALVSVGLLAMTAAGATTSWLRLAPGMLAAGVGIGLANPAIAATALAVVPPKRSGLAAGVSNTCRLAGVAVGIAVLGAVMNAGVAAHLPSSMPHAAAIVASGHLDAAAALLGGSHALAVVQEAFMNGLRLTLGLGAALAAAGAVAAIVLVRQRAAAPASAPSGVPVAA